MKTCDVRVNWGILEEKTRDFRINGGFEETHDFRVKWGILKEKTRDFLLNGGFAKGKLVIFTYMWDF